MSHRGKDIRGASAAVNKPPDGPNRFLLAVKAAHWSVSHTSLRWLSTELWSGQETRHTPQEQFGKAASEDQSTGCLKSQIISLFSSLVFTVSPQKQFDGNDPRTPPSAGWPLESFNAAGFVLFTGFSPVDISSGHVLFSSVMWHLSILSLALLIVGLPKLLFPPGSISVA